MYTVGQIRLDNNLTITFTALLPSYLANTAIDNSWEGILREVSRAVAQQCLPDESQFSPIQQGLFSQRFVFSLCIQFELVRTLRMKTAVSNHEYAVLGNAVGAYKEEGPITI